MSDFDIQTLSNFVPPKYMCLCCRAIFLDINDWTIHFADGDNTRLGIAHCPICGEPEIFDVKQDSEVFVEQQLRESISFGILDFQHAQSLSNILEKNIKPLKTLFQILLTAKRFIHFLSTGYSAEILGAMKMASVRGIKIRGIISGMPNYLEKNIKESEKLGEMNEISLLRFPENYKDYKNIPHTKLIVVDGMLAFKGGVNLTMTGIRRPNKNLDIFEPVTKINEVIDLHNKLFCPTWYTHMYPPF